jgi:hypothetical protein
MSAFQKVAEEVMDHEVTALVGPQNQTNRDRDQMRGGSEPGYCVVGGRRSHLIGRACATPDIKEVPLGSYE